MSPRTRTLTPTASTARRPRVAGMRDPRRRQGDAAESETDIDAGATEPGSARPATALTDDPARAGHGELEHAGGDTLTTPTEEPTGEADAPARPGTTAQPGPALEVDAPEVDRTPGADEAGRTPEAGRARQTRRAKAGGPVESAGEPGRLRRVATAVAAPFRRLGRSRVGLPAALAAVVVVCGLLAGLAAFSGHQAWTDGPVANTAVTDVSATAELVGQAREGVEKVFSYDFARLDDSLAAARDFGTGEFPSQYQQVFDETIRPQAGPQQLRQTATVLDIGVRSINGDTASVMALVQFHAERLTTKQSTDAPGLLALDMQRVDGRWKLAKLTPLTAQP